MNIRKYLKIFVITFLMLTGFCISAAADVEYNVTKNKVTAANVPENASMIVAIYNGTELSDVKIYEGSETITANYAEDMKDTIDTADNIKVFLWDLDKAIPLASAYSQNFSGLTDKTTNRILTVYFSATGNTRSLAQKIIVETNSDVFEIIPEQEYTSADLNYNDSNCRANKEQNDSSARPAISNKIENIADYDVVFIGYPIWWGTMPKIINTFLDTYDLSGKTIMPFCTSGSSGISSSVSAIKSACPNSTVTTGFRGTSATTAAQIRTWLDENGFDEAVYTRIKLTANGKEIIIRLNNNDTAADLISAMPCELDFSDFNGTEKIAYPAKTLNTTGVQSGTTPFAGDLTLYKPWGNLALFYKNWSYSDDLIPLGKIEKGIENISELNGTVKAEIL